MSDVTLERESALAEFFVAGMRAELADVLTAVRADDVAGVAQAMDRLVAILRRVEAAKR